METSRDMLAGQRCAVWVPVMSRHVAQRWHAMRGRRVDAGFSAEI